MINIVISMVFSGLLLQTAYTVYKYKLAMNIYWCAYYVFVVFFVLPEWIFALAGGVDYTYYYLRLMKDNVWVDIIYALFAAAASMILRSVAIRRTHRVLKNKSVDLKSIEWKFPLVVLLGAFTFTLAPTISAMISPQPELYFSSFIPFYRTSIYNVTAASREFHRGIMNYVQYIGFVGVVVLWLHSVGKHKQLKYMCLRVYLSAVALQILLYSNKRTFGLLAIIVLLIIDFIYKGKKPIGELIVVLAFCIGYFVIYQIVSGKNGGIQSLNLESYALYFSRVTDFKFVIYSLIEPNRVQLMDHYGQSFLFDLFFYVPRSLWQSKPYGFGVYYSAAIGGYTAEQVGTRYLTSWFAEALGNLSWFGIPFGIWFYVKLMDVFAKFKHPLVSIFSVYVSIYFMVTQVGSSLTILVILFLLWLVFEKKAKKKETYKEHE